MCAMQTRALPFADNTFDVIVSSLVLHNIHGRAERAKALSEIARVLKPGGHASLLDVAYTTEYAQVLEACNLRNIRISRPRWLFFLPARTVTGQKPNPRD